MDTAARPAHTLFAEPSEPSGLAQGNASGDRGTGAGRPDQSVEPRLASDGPAPRLPLDEEPEQHVPGSFLEALPQFFVFPLILVATLTLAWLGLRMLVGSGPGDAREAIAEIRGASGPHARWQAMYALADGLARGRFTLDAVPAADLVALYTDVARDAGDDAAAREQSELARRYLLSAFQYKRDPALTSLLVGALGDESAPVRVAALGSLAIQADPATRGELAPFLAARTPEERYVALAALARLALAGDAPSRELVAGCLGGPDAALHRNAVLALAALRDGRATPFLPDLLVRDHYVGDRSVDPPDAALLDEASLANRREGKIEECLTGACEAAAALGDPTLVPALQALRSNDPSIKVRSAAINALLELGVDTEST